MKKSLLTGLFCIVSVLLFTSQACFLRTTNTTEQDNINGTAPSNEGEEHTHTYAAAWTNDETNHWHTATCEHTTFVSDQAAHSFKNNICSICGYTIQPASITMAEFMNSHKEDALNFINTVVREDMVGDRVLLSENWSLFANENDELDAIRLMATCKTGETSRSIELFQANFTNPIDLDKIIDKTQTFEDAKFTVDSSVVFEFDAKENYTKSDLGSSLYNLCGDTSSIMHFTEVESSTSGVRNFLVAEETQSHDLKIYGIEADCGKNDQELIENLNYSYNYNLNAVAEYDLHENQINVADYQMEEFAPETVADAITDYSQAIVEALNENMFAKVTKACYGRTFDESKLLSATWDIGNGDKISEIKFISTYATSNANTLYTIGTITLSSPINIKDLTKSNINEVFAKASTSATATRNYYVNYNPQKQNDRNELVNAICEAYGLSNETPEGATRYYVDKGTKVDGTLASEVNEFQIVEIGYNYVKEFSINIKTSSNDNSYIQKLQNSSNYKIHSEKSFEYNGQKLSNQDVQVSYDAIVDYAIL